MVNDQKIDREKEKRQGHGKKDKERESVKLSKTFSIANKKY
jgi:hypothetical protein